MIWIICISFSYFQLLVDCNKFSTFTKLSLAPANASGSEALAFDAKGDGPYTGVADGRIMKYYGPNIGFLEFATTSPSRNKTLCDGTNGAKASTCGRTAGLGFNYLSGGLYVLDSFFGFQVVWPEGGEGIPLATGYNGTKFSLPNALDIDQQAQIVYFTDSGNLFLTRNYTQIIHSGDTSGKLFKYDIKASKLTFLLGGLSGPAGLAISKDGRYLVISEFIKSRIRRFWLKGPRSFTSEILLNLPGNSDNVKRTVAGDFWTAVTIPQPPPAKTFSAIGVRFDGFGKIVKALNFTSYYDGSMITEVQEYDGKLYVASTVNNFVGVLGTPN